MTVCHAAVMSDEQQVDSGQDDDFADVLADDHDPLPVDDYRLSTRPTSADDS